MAYQGKTPLVYEFAPFRLDTGRRLLTKEGEKVQLGERPFGVLLALVERAGEVVTEDDLLKTVWGEKAYELNANDVPRQIHVLRRKLGEVPGENKYIATVPGEGYRFVAQAETVQRPPSMFSQVGNFTGVDAGGDTVLVLCKDELHLTDVQGTTIRPGDTIMLNTVDEAGNSAPSRARVFQACPNSNELLVMVEGYVTGILKLDVSGNFVVEEDPNLDPESMVKVTIMGGTSKIPRPPVVNSASEVLVVIVLPWTHRAFEVPKNLFNKT